MNVQTDLLIKAINRDYTVRKLLEAIVLDGMSSYDEWEDVKDYAAREAHDLFISNFYAEDIVQEYLDKVNFGEVIEAYKYAYIVKRLQRFMNGKNRKQKRRPTRRPTTK